MTLQSTLTAQPAALSPEAAPEQLVEKLARDGRAAQRVLAKLTDVEKAAALRAAATALREAEGAILEANAQDIAAGEAK
ncbi:MAG: gamma-glutamyl-phosphate reductase, partial [Novosphingobium sp.]